MQISSNTDDISQLPLPPNIVQPTAYYRDSQYSQSIIHSMNINNDPLKHISAKGPRDDPVLVFSDVLRDATKDSRFAKGRQLVPHKPRKEVALEVDDLDIPWSDLFLKERISAGIFWPLSEELYFDRIGDHFPCSFMLLWLY